MGSEMRIRDRSVGFRNSHDSGRRFIEHDPKNALVPHFTPGGGSDFCAAHKISSPGEAYEPARNLVKYKKMKGGGVRGRTGTGAFS